MRKLLLCLSCLAIIAANGQNRLLDQPMEIRSVKMKVKADCFTAVTHLEIEFYNKNEQEIEGLFRFKLRPGQIITGFQLDLNGKFRDGSIEEKRKAQNAYNTIVGKRIDPAILSLEYDNAYRLNVYPVPAKKSRRVTIRIHELLKKENKYLLYDFSFNNKDTAKKFEISIETPGCYPPSVTRGLIASSRFINKGFVNELLWNTDNVSLSKTVGFSLPAAIQAGYCIQKDKEKTFFALNVKHDVPATIEFHPKKLLVYWDVSGSSKNRNREREISFLKQYIQRQHIRELRIIAFSEQTYPAQIFNTNRSNNWIDYLLTLEPEGITRMDQLDLSDKSADVIFLFSDGIVSIGSKTLSPAIKPLFAISSSIKKDSAFLKLLVGKTGGHYIDLRQSTVPEAIDKSSIARVELLSVKARANTAIEYVSASKTEHTIFGQIEHNDIIEFTYGTKSSVLKTEHVYVDQYSGCPAFGIDRLRMLYYSPLVYDWQSIFEFGIREKVVTQYTSYLVLERVEDYIKYNITPPAELEFECALQGFVKSDKMKYKEWGKKDEFSILNEVVTNYNRELKRWDPTGNSAISISRLNPDTIFRSPGVERKEVNADFLSDGFANSVVTVGQEVVVTTAYGMKRSLRNATVSAQVVTGEDLNTIRQVDFTSALAGKVSGIQVRSQSMIKLGDAGLGKIRLLGETGFGPGGGEPIYVLDGTVLIDASDIILDNVEDVTILQGAAASAIFGPQGARGAVVINSKKPSRGYYNYRYNQPHYKLKNQPDAEYLQKIKAAARNEKLNCYKELLREYSDNAIFYIDMADHLHSTGFKKEAMGILLNAAEVSSGDQHVLRTIAYYLESWKEMDRAIEIYVQLLKNEPGDLNLYRDLAWAYYQAGNYQSAVNILFTAIRLDTWNNPYYGLDKGSLLNELNAIIHIHRDSLDLKEIPVSMIRPMPVDLRIILSGNTYFYNMTVKEPQGHKCNYEKPLSKSGGYLKGNYHYYTTEYNIRKALPGKYKISVSFQDPHGSTTPQMIRLVVFKNYGSKSQTIEVQNLMMNNQSGQVEIGEVEW